MLTLNIRTKGPLLLSLVVAGTLKAPCMAEFNPSLDIVQLEAKDPYRVQKIAMAPQRNRYFLLCITSNIHQECFRCIINIEMHSWSTLGAPQENPD